MTLQTSDVRRWARKARIHTGKRGRLPHATVSAYLHAHPALTRELAADLGVDVGARGPVSTAVCDEVARLR